MARIEIPFAGSSRQGRSSSAANQKSINWYTQIEFDDTGKEKFRTLIGTPGKSLLFNVSDQPCRALHTSSTKFARYWAVFGNQVWEFLPNGTKSIIGTIPSSDNGYIGIADNGTHLLIVDGTSKGYIYDIANSAFSTVVDINFIGGDFVVFTGGYFFVIQPGSNVIQACVAPYGTSPTTWDAAAVQSTALTEAGPLIALAVANDLLWAFGDFSAAVFQNAGNATGFPFSLVPGVSIHVGTSSKRAVKAINGAIIWPAKTREGERLIYKAEGLTVGRISDHALENEIGAISTIADSFADTYIEEGHSFYKITFPTGNITKCWDMATGEWHDRASSDLGRDRGFGHIFFNGQHIESDSTTGNIYQSSLDIYSDNGKPLVATRRCQYLRQARNPLEIPALIIEADIGVGLPGDVDGSNPEMSLRYSRDGKTMSDFMYSPMGRAGEFNTLVRFPRLGQSENWQFEISVSAPVKRNIVAAYVEA